MNISASITFFRKMDSALQELLMALEDRDIMESLQVITNTSREKIKAARALHEAQLEAQLSERMAFIQKFLHENANRDGFQVFVQQSGLSVIEAYQVANEQGLFDKEYQFTPNTPYFRSRHSKEEVLSLFKEHSEVFRKETQNERTMGEGKYYILITSDGIRFKLSQEGAGIDWYQKS